MSQLREIQVPDLGEAEAVDVVEVLVSPGDTLARDDALVTLESDKASMDVPSPVAGTVREVRVERGARVAQGAVLAVVEVAEAAERAAGEGGGAAEATEGTSPRGTAPGEADLAAEVVVLGGGPGGYTAAFRAADLGKRVVLVERYPTLGGVCLNVGCIPSKALLHTAEVIAEAAEMAERGVTFGPPQVDLERLRAWKDGVVRRLTGGLARLAERRRVEVVQGTARFVSPRELTVDTPGGPRRIRFDNAIVAVGSRPVELPGIPYDDPRVLGSTAALELGDVPRRLLVVGGGIIGLELATVYHALGSRITVVELTEGLLPGTDRDLVRPLEKRLRRRYEAIHLGTRVGAVEAGPDGLRVSFEGDGAPPPQLFDKVLVSVGRRPNGDRIGAAAAGLEIDPGGFLRVDAQQRTGVPHIFAIGDVVGPPMLAHKASHQGKVAAEVAAGGKAAFDARVIPAVAYTDPEVAWLGVTEIEARERGIEYMKGTFPWSASGRALGLGRDEGLTKLLFDPATRRVIGAGIVGPNAGDLIAETALAVEMGCEAADLGLTVHPHPTLSETIGLAAEVVDGTVTEILPPRRKR